MTDLNVIPRPASIETTEGSWRLPRTPQVLVDSRQTCLKASDQLVDTVRRLLPKQFEVRTSADSSIEDPDLTLSLSTPCIENEDESYTLRIEEHSATIEASGRAGLVWGVQTLRQLVESSPEVPHLVCRDKPRFRWRGMHLDVARHFFPTEFILKFLDLLSRHKLNMFHWHLTDDQGWRLALDSYPRLTEIGAWRNEADGTRYGGYYSRHDVRRVIDHARALGITVVPEIDLPGHVSAVLAAYPELSCDGRSISVPHTWGIFQNTLCSSRRSTYDFVEGVLTEVSELFDSSYIHIGGDECPAENWERHPACLDLMARASIPGTSGLQGYFNDRAAGILKLLGRKLLGWDEILETGAPSDAAIMCWRGLEYAEQAVAAGHKVVLSPMSHCYFDFYQAKEGEPKAIGGHLPLAKVYEFEPLGSEQLEARSNLVLGGQGNVWTEYMNTPQHVEYMTIPRICALSEALWSKKGLRDFDSFLRRLPAHLGSLARDGYGGRPL